MLFELASLANGLDTLVLLDVVQIVCRLAPRCESFPMQGSAFLTADHPCIGAILPPAKIRHSIILECRLEVDICDQACISLVEVIVTELLKKPLEWINLELVEGRAHVISHFVDLIVVIRARGEALKEKHRLLGHHLSVAVLQGRLVDLDLLRWESVRVLPISQV